MNHKEKELETVQLIEESAPEWVNLWDDYKNKKEHNTKQLTFDHINL